MPKTPVFLPGAKPPVGPFAPGVVAGPYLHISGQVPLDPVSGELAGEGFEAQARQVMRNVLAVLAAAGLGAQDLVRTNVYLADIGDYDAMNRLYVEHFGESVTARTTTEVGRLWKDVRIEMDGLALVR
jgi:2-iminobutanoate/2-iminopropanoate deaminase